MNNDVLKLLVLIIIILSTNGCLLLNSNKNYFEISSTNKIIDIDGFIGELEWKDASTIYYLNSPWDYSTPDSTIFRALWSRNNFYFCFEVIDHDLVILDNEDELSVANGDRVELFFSPTADLSSYFCLEINPVGKLLDYEASYYRKFNFSWDLNNYNIVGKKTPKGYAVEGQISLSELQNLGIGSDVFYFGVFRADYNNEIGNPEIWYSWINPKVDEADFHIPSAFAKALLVVNPED